MYLDVPIALLAEVALTALLAATTSAAAHPSGRVGGDGSFGRRFSELGYQYAPVTMVSRVISLGGMLFDQAHVTEDCDLCHLDVTASSPCSISDHRVCHIH